MNLSELGWGEPFSGAFEAYRRDGVVPARVVAAPREHYRLLSADGVLDARLSGKLRHEAAPGELPVVGDWVAARLQASPGSAVIVACLPRTGALVRKRPDRSALPQVLAANLHVVFLMTSMNRDFNPRRLERTLSVVREASAQPVVLLSKLDQCPDPEHYLAQAHAIAGDAAVHALSTHTGAGLDAVEGYLQPARTLAIIGSSGVGKSTLVNRLLGHERLATSAIRESDDKGRHTTTTRELFVLPGGALLIDTPGIRELALWDAAQGIAETFEDLEAIAAHCRFADCAHEREPGCALRAALEAGEVDAARHASYQKLLREQAFEVRKHDPRAMREHRDKTARVISRFQRTQRKNPKG